MASFLFHALGCLGLGVIVACALVGVLFGFIGIEVTSALAKERERWSKIDTQTF